MLSLFTLIGYQTCCNISIRLGPKPLKTLVLFFYDSYFPQLKCLIVWLQEHHTVKIQFVDGSHICPPIQTENKIQYSYKLKMENVNELTAIINTQSFFLYWVTAGSLCEGILK